MLDLIKGGSVPFISKVSSVLIVYLFYLFISRNYGAEVNGIFSTFITLLTILAVVSKMGFDTSIVKQMAALLTSNKSNLIGITHRKMSLITFSVSIIFSVIIYVSNNTLNELFFDSRDVFNFAWLALCLPIFSLLSLNIEALRGLQKMSSYAFLQNVSLYGFALLFLLILFQTKNSINPIYAFTFSLIFIFLVSIFLFQKNSPKFHKATVSSKLLLKESFPMLLSNSSFYLMSMIDILMISYFLPESETGIYSNASKVANLNILFLFAINAIASPKLAQFHSNQEISSLKAFVKETSRLSIILSLPTLLIILIFPEFLLSLFGEEFTAGKTVLIILAIGQFFNAVAGSIMNVLNMTGKEKVAKNIIISATIINFILNVILIPRYGIIGAAISTGFTTILWNGLGVISVYKHYKFVSITLPWQKA